jgi:3D (Asp-Asp-Asp) domain-containing protein
MRFDALNVRYLGWLAFATSLGLSAVGCGPATPWAAQSSPSYDDEIIGDVRLEGVNGKNSGGSYRVRSIGRVEPESPVENPDVLQSRIQLSHTDAKVVGMFRNTYYDFPAESEFAGAKVPLYDASCRVIADVKQDFHDALCVQGSGSLDGGTVVSFAKRGCACAQVCPRSGQQICFEALEHSRFPWGRGAAGKPITPLLTVAVDTNVIPLETSIYIPEFEGLPRDAEGTSVHDGCFIAQDRGFKVRGEHVDVFTGEPALTRLWNRLMPSNRGVTVVLESPKCERARN